MSEELNILTTTFILTALIHASTHVGVHETYNKARLKLQNYLCRNHDMVKAMRHSCHAAVRLMKKLETDRIEDPIIRAEFETAMDRLKENVLTLFPADENEGPIDVMTSVNLSMKENSQRFMEEIIAALDPISDEVKEILNRSFPAAFTVAFNEIGIKNNPKLHALLVKELLTEIRASTNNSEKRLEEIENKLFTAPMSLLNNQKEFLQFQRKFKKDMDTTLGEVIERLSHLEELQRNLAEHSSVSQYRDQIPVAICTVLDADRYPLTRVKIFSAETRIGRNPDSDIVLLGQTVSRRHAALKLGSQELVIKDTSKNGTMLDDVRVLNSEISTEYPTELGIGAYFVKIELSDVADNSDILSTTVIKHH